MDYEIEKKNDQLMAKTVEAYLRNFEGMVHGLGLVPDLVPRFKNKFVNKDIYLCLYPEGNGTLIYNSMTNFGSVRVAEVINLCKLPKPCTFFYLPIESIPLIFNTKLKSHFLLKKRNNNTYYCQASIIEVSLFIHKMCKLNNIKYPSISFIDNPRRCFIDSWFLDNYYSSMTVFEFGFSEFFKAKDFHWT